VVGSADLSVDERETLGIHSDRAYVLVEIDRTRPPGTALVQRGEYEALDQITLLPPIADSTLVVYDRDGTAYTREDL
jgi:hypothetical protein